MWIWSAGSCPSWHGSPIPPGAGGSGSSGPSGSSGSGPFGWGPSGGTGPPGPTGGPPVVGFSAFVGIRYTQEKLPPPEHYELGALANLPFIGPAFFRHHAMVYLAIALAIALAWFLYRGPAVVTFDPEQISVWEDTRAGANSPWAPIWVAPDMPADGKIVAKMMFNEPGTYVLRARADDGGLTADDEITVTVTR